MPTPAPSKQKWKRLPHATKFQYLLSATAAFAHRKNPIVTTVVVDHGADVADQWIADHCGTGDIVVTSDIPLAAVL